jgi:chloramphenicol-sensitive protein RarD
MSRKGLIYGAGAYLMWGFFPLYFKALQSVPALEIMVNRVVWSFLFLALVLLVLQEWPTWRRAIRQPRVFKIYVPAAFLLAANWLIYIYGVNSGQVVETSLGYFINPLLSVALGVVFLGEALRPGQWAAIGLAGSAVLYLTLQYGSLPWIALALAFTFGIYGLLKKLAPLGALHGLSLETAILFLPGLAYLLYGASQGSNAFVSGSWTIMILLALSGVITAIPLLLFASAAHSIPLYMIGILQYIAPTCQLLLGVLVFQEPFTPARRVGFILIWAALALYSLEGYLYRRQNALSVAAS